LPIWGGRECRIPRTPHGACHHQARRRSSAKPARSSAGPCLSENGGAGRGNHPPMPAHLPVSSNTSTNGDVLRRIKREKTSIICRRRIVCRRGLRGWLPLGRSLVARNLFLAGEAGTDRRLDIFRQ